MGVSSGVMAASTLLQTIATTNVCTRTEAVLKHIQYVGIRSHSIAVHTRVLFHHILNTHPLQFILGFIVHIFGHAAFIVASLSHALIPLQYNKWETKYSSRVMICTSLAQVPNHSKVNNQTNPIKLSIMFTTENLKHSTQKPPTTM